MLSNSLAPFTYANYDSALRQFFIFCTEENIAPLHATPATRVRYTAWLALHGRVAAGSLQPYFYAVNKLFRDHRRQPIAVGELMADARRGLEMLQKRLVPSASQLPLPAFVALDILLAAATLRNTLTWAPTTLPQLKIFRACLADCVNYNFFCRAKTGARCHTGDLLVDKPSQQIGLFVRKFKGDHRRSSTDKLVFSPPTAANTVLADLQDYYTEHRSAFCAKYYKRPPPYALRSFSPSDNSADWGAASTVSAWLALALQAVNTSAPAGFKWTSHSLRKGDASAACCIGAPLPVIKYMGAWAENNSVTEGKYIDPTTTPTPAAWRFFGWLTPSLPQHKFGFASLWL
jgi:hypothetical protein